MISKKNSSNILIVILIGSALLLGYAIYNQYQQKLSTNSTKPSQPKLLPTNLTDDERFILSPPSADASRSAKDKHAQTMAKLAKVGDSIEINDCQPTPLVIQVKEGSNLKIVNKDQTAHKITFDDEHIYKIGAKDDLTIKAEFKYKAGDYGYICEGLGLVGFVHIVPK